MKSMTRRVFLATGALAGSGLVLATYIGIRGRGTLPQDTFTPNVWLRISRDGSITITVHKSEMGQGVWTSLPMLVAEELDVAWPSIRIEQAPTHPRYGYQGTEGSSSVPTSWLPLREAGATARAMLIAAAARMWNVAPSSCETRMGVVILTSGNRSATYAELAEVASREEVPATVPLKSIDAFTLIGTDTPNVNTPATTDGSLRYGIDGTLPGMLLAVIERCPVFGGRLRSFDATRALATPGVREVIPIEPMGAPVHVAAGVAVLADSTWAALQGRNVLEVVWDPGEHSAVTNRSIRDLFRASIDNDGITVIERGTPAELLRDAPGVVQADYEVPYVGHASMEPMNCIADVRGGECDIWAPTQSPEAAVGVASMITGILPATAYKALRTYTGTGHPFIRVHTTFMGGAFGRRLHQDFVAEAVLLSKTVGAPVKVLWTREDDIRHDFYRPGSLHRLRALPGPDQTPRAWTHRIAGPSTRLQNNGPDPAAQEIYGIADMPYAMPNMSAHFVPADPGIPVGYWRGVAFTQNLYAIESFIDELAVAAHQDPIAYRLRLINGDTRLRNVLSLARERSGWDHPLPPGRGRGVAVAAFAGTCVAMVVEITVQSDGTIDVHNVTCVVDCGIAVNPNGVRAQVEGSVIFGLSAALKQEISVEGGRVLQGNFDDVPILTMEETPRIGIHIVPSTEPPGGVGEPAVPPVAPALANAVHAATGRRIRHLPITASDLL